MTDMDAALSEAITEIRRLRTLLRQCMGGTDMVDIGDGEVIGLHMNFGHGATDPDICGYRGPQSFRDIKQEIKNGV